MRPTFAGCPTSKWFGPHRIWVDDNDNDNDNNVDVDGHDQAVSPLTLSLILVRFRLIMCFRLPDSFNYDFRCRGEQLSAEHRVCPANWAGWATHVLIITATWLLGPAWQVSSQGQTTKKWPGDGETLATNFSWPTNRAGVWGISWKIMQTFITDIFLHFFFFFQVINHELWAIISITQQAVTF